MTDTQVVLSKEQIDELDIGFLPRYNFVSLTTAAWYATLVLLFGLEYCETEALKFIDAAEPMESNS